MKKRTNTHSVGWACDCGNQWYSTENQAHVFCNYVKQSLTKHLTCGECNEIIKPEDGWWFE